MEQVSGIKTPVTPDLAPSINHYAVMQAAEENKHLLSSSHALPTPKSKKPIATQVLMKQDCNLLVSVADKLDEVLINQLKMDQKLDAQEKSLLRLKTKIKESIFISTHPKALGTQ